MPSRSFHLFDGVRIEHTVIRQKHHDNGKVTVTAEVELAAVKERTIPVIFTFGGATASANVAVSRRRRQGIAVDRSRQAGAVVAGRSRRAAAAGGGRGDPRRPGRAAGRPPQARGRQPAGRVGTSLFFRVNGIDIFCKGANWIPADALPARITRERIRRLLEEAVQANMNMIRVWGGGFYEFDDFYDACDELGLLVWQDMMFSCSQYPSTPEFVKIVDAEMRYQVKRLASHAVDRALVRRQRDHRLAQLVRGIEEEPRPLPRQLRPPQPRHRARHRRERCRPPLLAVVALLGRARLWRRLARRQQGRHALLVGLARGQGFRALLHGQAALLLGVRLPVLPDHADDRALRRAVAMERDVPGDGVPSARPRPQRPHRRDDDALFPRPDQLRGHSSISASCSRPSPSRRRSATGGA